MQPKKFYALDMYSSDISGFWGSDLFAKANKNHFDFYHDRFHAEIESGLVEMRRGLSWDCLSEFDDDFFDYIYLDAGHDYESVSRDMAVILKKIKDGGIVQFNDYAHYSWGPEQVFYGVVPAVNRMVRETGSKIIYYCLHAKGFDDVVVKINKS